MIEGEEKSCKTTSPPPKKEEDRGEERKRWRRWRWMDGQTDDAGGTTAARQRSHRAAGEGDQVCIRGLKGSERERERGPRRAEDKEDGGCQDWRWDPVRSHFSSVLAATSRSSSLLLFSAPLSSSLLYIQLAPPHNPSLIPPQPFSHPAPPNPSLLRYIWPSGGGDITPAE